MMNLRDDPLGENLLSQTLDDAELGRMSFPRPIGDEDVACFPIAQRFGVQQGRCMSSQDCMQGRLALLHHVNQATKMESPK